VKKTTTAIAGLPLFEGVDPAEIDRLALDMRLVSVAAGQMVFSQNDESRYVLFLLLGALTAVYWTADGQEIVFTRAGHGACFGELSAIDNQPRSLAVVANTDVSLLRIEQDSFLMLVDEIPVLRHRLLCDLVARIRSLTRKTLELTTLTAEQRVCAYLTRLAIETGHFHPGAVIAPAPTHAEIASTIGCNREVVSRTISRLVRRQAIRSGRRRIELLDPATLTAAL
jgi:CRP-like cAMP-binding protein